jgi:anti-sigma factor RsiW
VNCHEAGRLLDPYIDNELDAAQAAEVAAHVRDCPACAHRLASLESLGRLVRGMRYRAAPANVRAAVANMPRPRPWSMRPVLAWAAVATLAVSVAGAMGFRAVQEKRATTALAEEIVDRHVRALASDRLVDVRSSNQHTVKPWFQGKLDFSPPVRDTSAAGFPLVGGRIDSVAGRRVAVLLYQRREHVIEVFISPNSFKAAGDDARSIRGFQERHWTAERMSFWAVSDLNGRELDEFAKGLR